MYLQVVFFFFLARKLTKIDNFIKQEQVCTKKIEENYSSEHRLRWSTRK